LSPRMTLVWLPDGRVIYPRSESSTNNDLNLWAIRADPRTGRASGSPARLTSLTGVGSFHLSATANGEMLAADISKRVKDVYIAELRDGQVSAESLKRLTLDDREDIPSDWTSDGEAVYFTSNRSGNWDVYRQGLQQRVAEPIVASAAAETNPVLSPDGMFLLFKLHIPGSSPETRLMKVPLTGGASERVMDLTASGQTFRCGREPQAPCVLAERHANEIVFSTFDLAAGRGRVVARVAPQVLTTSSWAWKMSGWDLSPDGSRIAILHMSGKPLGEKGGPREDVRDQGVIRIIPVAGDPVTDIPLPNLTEAYTLGWSADGNSLLVSASRGGEPGEMLVLRVDMQGRADVLLNTTVPHYYARASPNGKYLALGRQAWEENAWLLENF